MGSSMCVYFSVCTFCRYFGAAQWPWLHDHQAGWKIQDLALGQVRSWQDKHSGKAMWCGWEFQLYLLLLREIRFLNLSCWYSRRIAKNKMMENFPLYGGSTVNSWVQTGSFQLSWRKKEAVSSEAQLLTGSTCLVFVFARKWGVCAQGLSGWIKDNRLCRLYAA